jgi:hypothetical protein
MSRGGVSGARPSPAILTGLPKYLGIEIVDVGPARFEQR